MATGNLTILFTDMEGFTSRTSNFSRDQIDNLLAVHERLTATAVKEFDGQIVKNLGDGYMITFGSPTNAILAAKKIQEDIAVYNTSVPQGEQFWVRIAANSGEVTMKEGDVFGEPVNVTARLLAQTEPGDITFTESVYLAMNKTEIPTTSAGTKVLRGVPEAVKVYRVPRIGEKATPRGNVHDNRGNRSITRFFRKPMFALATLGCFTALLYFAAVKSDSLRTPQVEAQSDVLGTEDSETPSPTGWLKRLFGVSTSNGSSANGTNSSGGNTTASGGSSGSGSNNASSKPAGGTSGSNSNPTPTPCLYGVNREGRCRNPETTTTPEPTKAPKPTNTPKPTKTPTPTSAPTSAPTPTPTQSTGGTQPDTTQPPGNSGGNTDKVDKVKVE